MGLLQSLISMAGRAMSGGGNKRSGHGSSRRGGRAEMAQRVSGQVLEQVRKQGPDAAQRHLSKTKFGADPRARKAARAADDLARRFVGTGDAGTGPSGAMGTPPADQRPSNPYGERQDPRP